MQMTGQSVGKIPTNKIRVNIEKDSNKTTNDSRRRSLRTPALVTTLRVVTLFQPLRGEYNVARRQSLPTHSPRHSLVTRLRVVTLFQPLRGEYNVARRQSLPTHSPRHSLVTRLRVVTLFQPLRGEYHSNTA